MFSYTSQDNFNELVYSYWDNLPSIRYISADHLDTSQQEIRFNILAILREGIQEPHPDTSIPAHRHVLNIKEITSLLNKRLNTKKSVQTITHHVNILREADQLVKEVLTIKEKNHYTTYFGRTGKFYFFITATNEESYLETKRKTNDQLMKVYSGIRGRTGLQKFKNLLDEQTKQEYKFLSQGRNAMFMWFEKNNKLISESGANVYPVLDFLNNFVNYDQEYEELKRQIRKELLLD